MLKDFLATVNNIQFLTESYFLLKLQINYEANSLGEPGQFYELKVPDTVKLRIPISIYDADNESVTFMIKIIGEGTLALSKLKIGDKLNALGPLGNTFTKPEKEKTHLLISGGVGYAPLFFLKKNNPACSFTWFHGGRDKNEVFQADKIYTNDGSLGVKGFVTAELDTYLQNNKTDIIYTCGPKIMMKNIVAIADKYNVHVDASLEEYMACGMGVCYGCVTKIKHEDGFVYKTVCKDGPIFKGSEVIWDE